MLVVNFGSPRMRNPFVDSVQDLVENGQLFQIALFILVIQFINIDFSFGFLFVRVQKTRHDDVSIKKKYNICL